MARSRHYLYEHDAATLLGSLALSRFLSDTTSLYFSLSLRSNQTLSLSPAQIEVSVVKQRQIISTRMQVKLIGTRHHLSQKGTEGRAEETRLATHLTLAVRSGFAVCGRGTLWCRNVKREAQRETTSLIPSSIDLATHDKFSLASGVK